MDTDMFWGIIIGVIILLIVLREVWCWYFKINELIKLTKEQNELLQKLLDKK